MINTATWQILKGALLLHPGVMEPVFTTGSEWGLLFLPSPSSTHLVALESTVLPPLCYCRAGHCMEESRPVFVCCCDYIMSIETPGFYEQFIGFLTEKTPLSLLRVSIAILYYQLTKHATSYSMRIAQLQERFFLFMLILYSNLKLEMFSSSFYQWSYSFIQKDSY